MPRLLFNETSSGGIFCSNSTAGVSFRNSGTNSRVTVSRAFIGALTLAFRTVKLSATFGLLFSGQRLRDRAIYFLAVLISLDLVAIGTKALIAMGFAFNRFLIFASVMAHPILAFVVTIIVYMIYFKNSIIGVPTSRTFSVEQREKIQSKFYEQPASSFWCTHKAIL